MNRLPILAVLFLLGCTAFCQTANSSRPTPSNHAPELTQYRLEAVDFEGSRLFTPKELEDSFHVPIGDKFDHRAVGQGLDRLRLLYGDHGYINFTAVPMLRVDKERGTVALTLSLQDGLQFRFGRLILKGKETRAGEADALRNAWVTLSGKTYNSSLLDRWLVKNAPFLSNEEEVRRHTEMHLSSDTRQVNIAIMFPGAQS
jgi:hypothetical protein